MENKNNKNIMKYFSSYRCENDNGRGQTSCKKQNELVKKTPWLESTNELYRPRDRRLSVKLVPTFI
jgi:hypothetical protein